MVFACGNIAVRSIKYLSVAILLLMCDVVHSLAQDDNGSLKVKEDVDSRPAQGVHYLWEDLPSKISPDANKDRYDLFSDSTQEEMELAVTQVAERLDSFVNKVDTFFVDDRIDTMYRGNRLRSRFGFTLEEEGRSEFVNNLRLNLYMPRTEGKLGVFAESYSSSDEDDEIAEAKTLRADQEENSFATGFRAYLTDPTLFESKFDVGMRWDPAPDPFVRFRVSKDYPFLTDSIFRPAQSVYYEWDDGVGESTRIDLERRLTKQLLVRNRSDLTWSEKTVEDGHGAEWDTGLTFFRTFSNLRGVRGEFKMEGDTSPSVIVQRYLLSLRWREAIYSTWLFYEIEPFMEWVKEREFEASPGITFILEINFQVLEEDNQAQAGSFSENAMLSSPNKVK